MGPDRRGTSGCPKEKEDYNLRYSQQADRIEKARNARSAQDLGPYIVPELMLDQIAQEQDHRLLSRATTTGLPSSRADWKPTAATTTANSSPRRRPGQRGGSKFTP